MQIIVEEIRLTGPFSLPQQRGERLYLPLNSIARALGDIIRLDASRRTIRVDRQTGVEADFDSALNLVRENGATVLVLPGASDIDFPPQPEALMLPVELTAALLDVSIHIDVTARLISIRRGQALTEPISRAKREGWLELYDADYDYNLDQYPTGFNHNLTLRTTGRLFDGRFSFSSNVGGATDYGVASFNTGTFAFERSNGLRVSAGDVGVAGDLTFMSTMMRGVSAQVPLGSTRVSLFAGRSTGDTNALRPLAELRPELTPPQDDDALRVRRPTFDTKVAGAYFTFGSTRARSYHSRALQFSSGLMSFAGPTRRGLLVASGLRSASERYGLRADFGLGTFSGRWKEGGETRGMGAAADISGSFKVRDNLTIQGQYTLNSRNFTGARAGAPASLNLRSFGVTWSPRRWLTTTLTDTTSTRPGQSDSPERFTTAAFTLTPKRYLSNLFISHTQYSTTQVREGSHTLVNASKNLNRWSLFASGSRIKTGGDAYQHGQIGAHLRLRETDSLQMSQTIGSGATLGGSFDWMTQSFLTKRVALGAGVGYNRSASSPLSLYERLNANVNLPFKQTLQISYGHHQTGSQLHLSLRGQLFFRRHARTEASGLTGEANRYGSVSGRVYQDVNSNGRYDEGVDLPQANVRVRVDGNLSVDTDRSGLYKIHNAPAGEHTVTLDLLSVRADLTILGAEAQQVSLAPGLDTIVDFRTVRTGRITGAVWLDTNGNSIRDEGEQPLADVRIVTSTGRDTLTDEEGQFVFGDLAPGLHILIVDIKTLSEEMIVRASVGADPQADEAQRLGRATQSDGQKLPDSSAQPVAGGALQVSVTAGKETGGVAFAVSSKPPERKHF